ncbi:MAG: M28 family peptidase, partial [Flavobacteriales bacterium]|nr:M28 family peptidase [Flavobacteriales bacterium]
MALTGRWTEVSVLLGLAILIIACNPNRNSESELVLKPAPIFNSDSAYEFVAKQVAFGPRVPASEAHIACGDYLVSTLERYGFEVTEQVDSVASFGGLTLPLRNIIATYNSPNPKRIILAAHWDTRPYADRDDTLKTIPFDGANDGASGVGVLLEIARTIAANPLNIGVEIILFDIEDQGRPAYDSDTDDPEHYYCLGSRYWANSAKGHKAEYGILLDMVGAENARFTMEGVSMQYAEPVVRKVWGIGNQLGYSEYFRYNRTSHIVDDHTYINEIVGIPFIDIIHYDASTETRFWTKWHTHEDDLSVIDRNVLEAVGQTVLQT